MAPVAARLSFHGFDLIFRIGAEPTTSELISVVLECEAHELTACPDPCLRKYLLERRLHGALGNFQLVRDLFVHETVQHVLKYGEFAIGQLPFLWRTRLVMRANSPRRQRGPVRARLCLREHGECSRKAIGRNCAS